MPLSIRNKEVERLARACARRTGKGITDEILAALTERAARMESGMDRRRRIDTIIREFNSLPDLDTRSVDEILSCDETGVFGNGG